MRASVLPLALVLAGCSGDVERIQDTDSGDTGLPVCGRVRGTTGVLLYQDGGDTIRSPVDAADTSKVTTGIAGPLDDAGLAWVTVTDGRVYASEDAGCNWDAVGTLPASGDWALLAAGTRVYAFDRLSAEGAWSDDLGAGWTAFSTGEAFVGLPAVDPADTSRLRGVQARGVVTSFDAGSSWSVGGTLPTTPTAAAVSTSDLDRLAVGSGGGAWTSLNGGASWSQDWTLGAVGSVALHPDDGTLFLVGVGADANLAVWRADGERLGDVTQVEFPSDLPLYPLPGSPGVVLAGHGPVPNGDGDPSLALYRFTVGEGVHTVRIATFAHMNQLAFGPDRWAAAVDGVMAR